MILTIPQCAVFCCGGRCHKILHKLLHGHHWRLIYGNRRSSAACHGNHLPLLLLLIALRNSIDIWQSARGGIVLEKLLVTGSMKVVLGDNRDQADRAPPARYVPRLDCYTRAAGVTPTVTRNASDPIDCERLLVEMCGVMRVREAS